MKKEIFLSLIFVFIVAIMLNSVSAATMITSDAGVRYSSDIPEEFNKTGWVRIMVDIYNKNATMINNIISDLGGDFVLKRNSLGNDGFYGNVTKQGFEKLVKNPGIKNIYLDRIGHVATVTNEYVNETEYTIKIEKGATKTVVINNKDYIIWCGNVPDTISAEIKVNDQKIDIKESSIYFIEDIFIFVDTIIHPDVGDLPYITLSLGSTIIKEEKPEEEISDASINETLNETEKMNETAKYDEQEKQTSEVEEQDSENETIKEDEQEKQKDKSFFQSIINFFKSLFGMGWDK